MYRYLLQFRLIELFSNDVVSTSSIFVFSLVIVRTQQLQSEDSSSLFAAKIKFLSIEKGGVRINQRQNKRGAVKPVV